MSDEAPAPYRPQPTDPSKVVLPPEIDRATEDLARNAHDNWAALRFSQGWRLGPERNDSRKEHPSLVPYESLPESEKEVDRETVKGTLKALMALGYATISIKPGPNLDDMLDAERWLDSRVLGEALRHCRGSLLPHYLVLDARAQRLQRWHFGLALIVIASSTIAIMAALAQVCAMAMERTLPLSQHSLECLEMGLGTAAALAAVIGILTGKHERWLLCRHKAERLRYAKFRLLSSPDFWMPERRHLALKKLDDARDTIERLDAHGVRRWLEKDEVPCPPTVPMDARLDVAAIRALRDYYHDTRFAAQLAYLAAKARPASEPRRILKWLPQALFFATAGIISVHFWLASFRVFPSKSTVPLILAAVLLPVFGAAFRTFFMARELGRNATRSAAKHLALEDMTRPLREEVEPEVILRSLWACEYILESDHREWLRLMVDAEWYG